MRPIARRALLALLAAGCFVPAWAEDDPGRFVGAIVGEVLGVLRDTALSAQEREERLRTIGRGAFDIPTIARFVSGPAWRAASQPERDAFATLIEDYVLRVYAARITTVETGWELKVKSVRPEGGSGGSLVSTDFLRPNGGPPVRADWSIANRPEGLRVVDIRVEGISLAVTQRDEFAAVLQRSGGTLAGLSDAIRARIATAQSEAAARR